MVPRVAWLAVVCLLAACAEVPPAPPASSAPSPSPTARPRATDPLASTINAWRQRALTASAAGDLAVAEISWHVVTLLAPEEPSYQHALASTRAAIRREVDEAIQSGNSAIRGGDSDRASAAFLRALALDPDNAEAARALREIDRRKLGRIQADRAAKVRAEEPVARAQPSRSAPANDTGNGTYEVEQALEIFNAGDINGGLRDLRSWIDAHPQDRVARHRIAVAVFDRAAEFERRGSREQALSLYETAIALRGEPASGWPARVDAVRKALSNEYYDRGVRAERTDLEAAVRAFEASVRYDSSNVKASARLAQTKTALAKLKQLDTTSK